VDCGTDRTGESPLREGAGAGRRGVAAEATFSVAGLAAGAEIEVLDEDRVLPAEAGGFHDAFPPLGVHLYRIKNANGG